MSVVESNACAKALIIASFEQRTASTLSMAHSVRAPVKSLFEACRTRSIAAECIEICTRLPANSASASDNLGQVKCSQTKQFGACQPLEKVFKYQPIKFGCSRLPQRGAVESTVSTSTHHIKYLTAHSNLCIHLPVRVYVPQRVCVWCFEDTSW